MITRAEYGVDGPFYVRKSTQLRPVTYMPLNDLL
jgi:hypothetical protein